MEWKFIMKSNKMERNRMKWRAIEWNGVKSNDMERNRMTCSKIAVMTSNSKEIEQNLREKLSNFNDAERIWAEKKEF